jgi:hypothetical protein
MLAYKNGIQYKPNLTVTSKKYIEYADTCRVDEYRCGLQGKHFMKEPHLHTKILKHHLLFMAPFCSTIVMLYITFK